MKIEIQNKAKDGQSLLVFACVNSPLGHTEGLNKETLSVLNRVISHPVKGESGEYRQVYENGRRLHVYVLPDKSAITQSRFGDIMAKICNQLAANKGESLNVLAENLQVRDMDRKSLRTQIAVRLADVAYEFEGFKSGSKSKKKSPATVITITIDQNGADTDIKNASEEAADIQALIDGMKYTKDLANTPPNVCTPLYLATQARSLATQHKTLKCKVLDEKEMKKLHMNTYLAVARGSANPPQFILMEYTGASKKNKPFVFLGKGITFDTGGISIKPAAEMDEMKYDMGGAAAVFGVMHAVCKLKLPINLVGAVAAAENMPGSNAYRPGDILHSMSGQTVEVLNTDAEGRLVLADALTYLKRYKPAAVIDAATLTGACIIALGNLRSGFFANEDLLADQMSAAAKRSCDLIWRMPMDSEYMKSMESNFADIANIGGRREAGTITAAGFLEKFVSGYPWAHLDIAGTAWHSGKRKGATGRPVPLLLQFLMDRARDNN